MKIIVSVRALSVWALKARILLMAIVFGFCLLNPQPVSAADARSCHLLPPGGVQSSEFVADLRPADIEQLKFLFWSSHGDNDRERHLISSDESTLSTGQCSPLSEQKENTQIPTSCNFHFGVHFDRNGKKFPHQNSPHHTVISSWITRPQFADIAGTIAN
ncbi:MAG: hypothetical protein AAGC93_22320 [Cyanobacteria bacterium P01_F01_bin.53]